MTEPVSTPHEAPESSEQAPKPQRPATLVFTQTVLMLQAFVALFATLVLWSFAQNGILDIEPWVALVGGLTLMLALGYVSRKQTTRWGRVLGWVLQLPMLVAALLEPAIAVIGGIFLILWLMALRIGGRIDRERKERLEAAASHTDEDGE